MDEAEERIIVEMAKAACEVDNRQWELADRWQYTQNARRHYAMHKAMRIAQLDWIKARGDEDLNAQQINSREGE
jgi:hypothetical protein